VLSESAHLAGIAVKESLSNFYFLHNQINDCYHLICNFTFHSFRLEYPSLISQSLFDSVTDSLRSFDKLTAKDILL
jgi:hypothetical protein